MDNSGIVWDDTTPTADSGIKWDSPPASIASAPPSDAGIKWDDTPSFANVDNKTPSFSDVGNGVGTTAPPSFGNVSNQNNQPSTYDKIADWSNKATDSVQSGLAEIPSAAYQGLASGSAGLGKWAGLGVAGAAGVLDTVAGTNTQDSVFKSLVQPFDTQQQIADANVKKDGLAGKITAGVTKGLPDLALAGMSGGETEALPILKWGESAASNLARTIAEGVAPQVQMAAPLAAKAAGDAYGQAIEQGKAPWDATTDALKAIGNVAAMSMAVPGEGPLLSRMGQGVIGAAGTEEATRVLQGQAFDPTAFGSAVAMGAGFGLAGHSAPDALHTDTAPDAIAAREPDTAPAVNADGSRPLDPEMLRNPQPEATVAPEATAAKPRGTYNHDTNSIVWDDAGVKWDKPSEALGSPVEPSQPSELGQAEKAMEMPPESAQEPVGASEPAFVRGSNANGDFITVPDKGAGVSYKIDSTPNGVFVRTETSGNGKTSHSILNQEGDLVNPNSIVRNNSEGRDPSELAWSGTPEERAFVEEQIAHSSDLNNDNYAEHSQIVKDLVTGKTDLATAKERADALMGKEKPVEAVKPVQQDAAEAFTKPIDTPPAYEHVPDVEGFEDLVPNSPKKAVEDNSAEPALGEPGASPLGGPAPGGKDEIGRWQYNMETQQMERAYDVGDAKRAAAVVDTPESVLRDYHNGELTTRKLYEQLANDTTGRVEPETKALAAYKLAALDRRSNGGIAKIERYNPNNPSHVAEMPNVGQGYYHPVSNAIRLNRDAPNIHLLMHEADHAEINRAVIRGERGLLGGQAKAWYSHLNDLFGAFKDHATDAGILKETINSKGQKALSHYGFTNLNEYLAEFSGNSKFREVLKGINLDDVKTKPGSFGEKAIGNAKNLYQATVRGIRGMLGLPEKANTAYEATFSAMHGFTANLRDEHFKDVRNIASEKPTELPNSALATSKEDILARAKAAVDKGADPEAVRQRTQELLAKHGHELDSSPSVKDASTVPPKAPISEGLHGVTNNIIRNERDAKGLDQVVNDLGRGREQMRDTAMQRIKQDPTYAQNLADSVAKSPRPLTGEEVMALNIQHATLALEARASRAKAAEAVLRGDKGQELLSNMDLEAAARKTDTVEIALNHAGTENSYGLSARQAMLRDDFTISNMKNQAIAAKGAKLSPKDEALIKSQSDKIQELQDKLALAQKETAQRSRSTKVKLGDKIAADKEFSSLSQKLKEMNEKDKRSHCLI